MNLPHEILAELAPFFTVEARNFFLLSFVPLLFSNLVIA